MSAQTVNVAVIEWDSSEVPSIFIGQSWASVARKAAETIQQAGYYMDDDPDYFEDVDHPERRKAPSEMTLRELEEWHADLREAVTVPWVTFEVETVLP